MKIHKRVQIVGIAGADIGIAIGKIVERDNLTYGEVAAILAEQLASYAKYQIREERHGNTETPGGEE